MARSCLLIVILIVAMALPAALFAADDPAEAERALIEEAARDYIEGWYEGDADRMERALHPDLVKRFVKELRTGRAVLDTVSADGMVEYTRAGGGSTRRREGQKNEVIILDVLTHTASVKAISPDFIDYLHLAKVNGRWQIVNVLWESTKPDQ